MKNCEDAVLTEKKQQQAIHDKMQKITLMRTLIFTVLCRPLFAPYTREFLQKKSDMI